MGENRGHGCHDSSDGHVIYDQRGARFRSGGLKVIGVPVLSFSVQPALAALAWPNVHLSANLERCQSSHLSRSCILKLMQS